MFDWHGTDIAFCKGMAERAGYTVLDVRYRLGPEKPFPAGLNDAEDAIRYILSRPDEYDASRIAVAGSSSGGNIATAAAAALFPPGTINSLLAFYPLIDLAKDPTEKVCVVPNGEPLSTYFLTLSKTAYVPSNFDARDPRIPPALADPKNFPQNVLIITAGLDNFVEEGETLGRKLKEFGKSRTVVKRFKDCTHGWDKKPKDDKALAAREDLIQLSVDFLLHK